MIFRFRARHLPLSVPAVCAALSSVLMLAACGQTGPLTLRGYPENTPWPVHTPPPASAAPEKPATPSANGPAPTPSAAPDAQTDTTRTPATSPAPPSQP